METQQRQPLNQRPPTKSKIAVIYTLTALIAIVVMILLLSSCGSVKRAINKNRSKKETTTQTETVTTKTVTETIDTLITIKPDSLTIEAAVDSLLKGFDKIDETETTRTVIKYDTIRKKIIVNTYIKAKPVPVKFTRQTVQHSKSKQQTTVKEKQFTKTKDVERTASNWYWWFIAGFVSSVLLRIFYRYLKTVYPILP
jgi:hypothetical protein